MIRTTKLPKKNCSSAKEKIRKTTRKIEDTLHWKEKVLQKTKKPSKFTDRLQIKKFIFISCRSPSKTKKTKSFKFTSKTKDKREKKVEKEKDGDKKREKEKEKDKKGERSKEKSKCDKKDRKIKQSHEEKNNIDGNSLVSYKKKLLLIPCFLCRSSPDFWGSSPSCR